MDIRCLKGRGYNSINNRGNNMDILKKVAAWASQLTEVGISLIALGVVLEVLFGGMSVPFWPNISVIDNIMGILGSLSAEGLLGLVGLYFLYHIFNKK